MIWIPTLGVKCLPCWRRLSCSSSVSGGLLRRWDNCMVRDCLPKRTSDSCAADDDSAGATSPHKSVHNHAWILWIFQACWCLWWCIGTSWVFLTRHRVSPSLCRHPPLQQGDQSLARMSPGALSHLRIPTSPGFWRVCCYPWNLWGSSTLRTPLRYAYPLGGLALSYHRAYMIYSSFRSWFCL